MFINFTGGKTVKDKVAVTKTIRQYTGLGLAEAKKRTDRILAREITEFEIPELHTAEDFLGNMKLLGIEGKMSMITAESVSVGDQSNSQAVNPTKMGFGVLEPAVNQAYL